MKKFVFRVLKRSARRYIKRFSPYVIALTGSVGKTSARMIIAQTTDQLVPEAKISTSPKNFNTEVGLCLSILEIKDWSTRWWRVVGALFTALSRGLFGKRRYDVLVAEYGIDHAGDMDYLLSIVKPDMSIFTVLDKVHALQMGSPDEILKEKAKVFSATKDVVFVSVPSLSYTRKYLEGISADYLSYALHEADANDADIWWRNKILGKDENDIPYAQFTLEQGKDSVHTITTNLLGNIDAGYISLAVECSMIVAMRIGKTSLDHEDLDRLEYTQQAGRMNIFPGQWGSILIDSSYNAAPKSMQELINTVVEMRNNIYQGFDLIYCLGDMRELGSFSEQEHRSLASYVAQSADAIYLVGEEMGSYMIDELKKVGYNSDRVFWFPSSTALGEKLLEDISNREDRSLILFKGSQNTIFLEEAIAKLLKSPKDKNKLVRQSPFWKRKKAKQNDA